MNMNKTDSFRGREHPVRRQQGFTLVELVVTMVIAAILASIAIPSYTAYILKSHRTDAKSALLGMAALEERYFSTNNTYSSTPSDLGYPVGTTVAFPVGNNNDYNITSLVANPAVPPVNTTSVGTPATYTIIATAINSQVNDAACATFQITSGGVQTATGTDPNASVDCWK
jgi:type IV pilus assembly protein PilE